MVKRSVSVIGAGSFSLDSHGRDLERLALELGRLIVRSGHDLVCGGMGGVMAAACRGAWEERSLGQLHSQEATGTGEKSAEHPEAGSTRTIGILPGHDRAEGNAFLDVAVATGLGQMRNYLVVVNGDAAVAVGGGGGTLSEIGLALKIGRPVVAIGNWAELPGVTAVPDAQAAMDELEQIFSSLDRQE